MARKGKKTPPKRAAASTKKQRVVQRPKGSSKSAKSAKRLPGGSMNPYTKLTLDPCEARLTSAPLPGRIGAQAMRVPFRVVLTVPTSTIGLQGDAQTGNTPCTAIAATIFPHAMNVRSAPYASPVVVQGFPAESSGTLINSSQGWNGVLKNFGGFVPNGLGQLYNISSEIRPIAACIKLGYIGQQGQNAGAFVAYEGQAAQLYDKVGTTSNTAGDTVQSMALAVPLSTLALDSWTTCDTTKTVEAKVNFAAADPYWQNFKPTSIPVPASATYVKGTGQLDSSCLADPDLTGLPVATVAISGAVAGTQYLLSGAIVYEWAPNVTLGMPAPQRSLRDPKTLQTVVSQLGKYGRMLVGLVSDVTNGTPPGLMLDIAMKAFATLAVGGTSRPNVPRIGM